MSIRTSALDRGRTTTHHHTWPVVCDRQAPVNSCTVYRLSYQCANNSYDTLSLQLRSGPELLVDLNAGLAAAATLAATL
jgi:hypothetical protein